MPSPAITTKQAVRRYALELSGVMVAYIGAVFAAGYLIPAFKPTGAALYALALAPAVPIALICVVIGRYLAGADEYVRAWLARSLLLAAAIVFSLATAWDFLRVYAAAPPIPPFVIGPGFFAALGLAQGLQFLFARARGGEG